MTQPDPAEKPAEKTSPWGEDFDAERAWRLVTNLRTEKADLAARLDALEADRKAAADAEKTEAQRAADARQAAEERAQAAERALWVERALRKHPLPEGLEEDDEADLLAFLVGDSEEAVVKKAARLEALHKAKTAEPTTPDGEPDGQAPPVTSRPEPRLTPTAGHGSTSPEPFDAAAVAAAIRSGS